ncbi:MAG: amidase [Alphaproteobacteria bacterium]|nr:amidase [Alphaproteobacteria bacterium]
MSDLDLAYMPGTEIARRIAAKELSPVVVVKNALDRIEEVNGKLNCFCFVLADEALAKAREAEAAVMRGDPLGPLHGLPLAIKDLTPTKGKRTTLGSFTHEHWVPAYSAVIVERLQAAGAIMVGKTMTPEFAYSSFTRSPLWGTTRNPWDLARSPGGSSGGSAAAVASGCVALAEGTDMGGSVRSPAAFCGLVGLKPSLGRIPMDILPSVFDGISHFGPLARTIDDAAAFLAAAAGPSDADIQSLPAGPKIPAIIPGDIAGKRLALDVDLGIYAVDPEVEALVRAAADALRSRGAIVEEVDLGWTRDMLDGWYVLWKVFMAAYFGHLLEEWRGKMDPAVVALIEGGRTISAVDYKRVEIVRTRQWSALAKVFARCDALLCPTVAQPAPANDLYDASFGDLDANGKLRGLDMTELFNNVPQCPALSVPAGFTHSGLPVGLQIVARRHDDLGALTIGKALESARPWSGRRPALS